MRLVEGMLTFLIFIMTLYIVYLYFKRTNPRKLRWNDTPPEPFEDVQSQSQQSTTPSQPKSPLATNEDYRAFFEWQTTFCKTWNKVIEQSMSTENYKGSAVDYVKNLQTQQSNTFVKCYDEITADPDPFAIQTKIPTVELYLATMNFMASQIASILQKTKDALAGNPQKEGFEDQQSCGCISPEAAATIQTVADTEAANAKKKAAEEQRLKKAIQQILSNIKPIVKDKASLEGQLTIINKGLNELLEYKRKAESGQLASEVKIPE